MGVQFLNLPGSSTPDGTNASNKNNFEVAFDGDGASTEGKGWYQGSGFLNEATGIVSSLKVDFDGGNTQDVTIDQLSSLGITLDTFQAADWDFFMNTVFGGNDKFFGSAHDDVLYGYKGDDIMFGGYGDKPNSGTFDPGDQKAPDFVTYPGKGYADDGDDYLDGGRGNDMIDGGTGKDTLLGGAGKDTLFGGGGKYADLLKGGDGRDKLFGDGGNDKLLGGAGKDKLVGGKHNDILDGGTGNDLLIGGTGNDLFKFRDNSGQDKIKDFNEFSNKEKIDLAAVSAIKNFKDLKNNHMTEDGMGNTIIDNNAGVEITLTGVDINDLGKGDFIF